MIRNKKMIISSIILSLSIFISIGFENKVECLSGENKIDLLIENKENQDMLKLEISKLKEEINNKIEILNDAEKETENNEGIQVVTVSFIKDSNLTENSELSVQTKIKEEIFEE